MGNFGHLFDRWRGFFRVSNEMRFEVVVFGVAGDGCEEGFF